MAEAPVVTVQEGQLQGRVVASPSGKSFYSFQGIPYAKPPLGSLRFKAPQPPEPWEGIRDATTEGNDSAQIEPKIFKQFVGDENCLFLNIFTPNLDGAFLPVMVYIHGGGFKFGSGSALLYGGDYLVERDVVVVTINYRCGALGFLSLNTPEVPGNAGLKDIVQAIRWVKENIHNFGGNSGNLTIFGESAGGAAVSILTASPASKSLISKAIIQSGTAISSWCFQKHPLDNARALARTLGCESDDVDDILEFLTATSVKDIVEANEILQPVDLFYRTGQLIFTPVVEKEFPDVEPILTEAFIDLLTSGRVADIPIMIGSTTLEFTFKRYTDDLQDWIPEDLKIEKGSEQALAIAEEIKKLYFKGSHTGDDSLKEYYELISDKLVNIDTHRYVQYLVQVTNKPIYYYKFDYVGELNLSKKLLDNGLGNAAHMDELGYIFKNDFQKDVEPTPEDIKMRERMLRLWTNFAKSGNPTPDENHYLNVTWPPVTKDNHYYLRLANELSVCSNPDNEKMEFWDALYSKYYKIWEHPKENTEEVPRKLIEIPEPIEQVLETEVDNGQAVESKDEEVEETKVEEVEETKVEEVEETKVHEEPVLQEPVTLVEQINGNGLEKNGGIEKAKPSNEVKVVPNSNGLPRDVIRANDPPEDDLPKNIGVNKFVNFFESLGGKK